MINVFGFVMLRITLAVTACGLLILLWAVYYGGTLGRKMHAERRRQRAFVRLLRAKRAYEAAVESEKTATAAYRAEAKKEMLAESLEHQAEEVRRIENITVEAEAKAIAEQRADEERNAPVYRRVQH